MQHSKAARRAIHKIHKGQNMWRLLAYTEYARGSVLRRQGMSIVTYYDSNVKSSLLPI
jgi:hypothetical protein